jgi:cytochrome c553
MQARSIAGRQAQASQAAAPAAAGPAVCVVPSSDLMMRLLHFVGVLCSSSAVASAQPGMTGGMPPPVRPPLARPCMHLSLHPPHSFSATTTCESCHRPVTTYAAS